MSRRPSAPLPPTPMEGARGTMASTPMRQFGGMGSMSSMSSFGGPATGGGFGRPGGFGGQQVPANAGTTTIMRSRGMTPNGDVITGMEPPWLKLAFTRDDAEIFLDRMPAGSFVVRGSSQKDSYSLTVKFPEAQAKKEKKNFFNGLIIKKKTGSTFIFVFKGDPELLFHTFAELVLYFSSNKSLGNPSMPLLRFPEETRAFGVAAVAKETAEAPIVSADDAASPWFQPTFARDEAESFVRRGQIGSFVIRTSSIPDSFCLTVYVASHGARQFYNPLIIKEGSGRTLKYFLKGELDSKFPSLKALVQHYCRSVSKAHPSMPVLRLPTADTEQGFGFGLGFDEPAATPAPPPTRGSTMARASPATSGPALPAPRPGSTLLRGASMSPPAVVSAPPPSLPAPRTGSTMVRGATMGATPAPVAPPARQGSTILPGMSGPSAPGPSLPPPRGGTLVRGASMSSPPPAAAAPAPPPARQFGTMPTTPVAPPTAAFRPPTVQRVPSVVTVPPPRAASAAAAVIAEEPEMYSYDNEDPPPKQIFAPIPAAPMAVEAETYGYDNDSFAPPPARATSMSFSTPSLPPPRAAAAPPPSVFKIAETAPMYEDENDFVSPLSKPGFQGPPVPGPSPSLPPPRAAAAPPPSVFKVAETAPMYEDDSDFVSPLSKPGFQGPPVPGPSPSLPPPRAAAAAPLPPAVFNVADSAPMYEDDNDFVSPLSKPGFQGPPVPGPSPSGPPPLASRQGSFSGQFNVSAALPSLPPPRGSSFASAQWPQLEDPQGFGEEDYAPMTTPASQPAINSTGTLSSGLQMLMTGRPAARAPMPEESTDDFEEEETFTRGARVQESLRRESTSGRSAFDDFADDPDSFAA